MKRATARAIADCIVPSVFNRQVAQRIAVSLIWKTRPLF
jgi:hypothetical protein